MRQLGEWRRVRWGRFSSRRVRHLGEVEEGKVERVRWGG